MLSDPVPRVLIPDRARCPASARAHLLLLSNGSLAKCPLACQSVNILFFFFASAAEAPPALPLCHLLCMRPIISWGRRGGVLWRRLMAHPICSQRAWPALPRRVPAPPQGPGIFYSGAGTARLLIYGSGEHPPRCSAFPRPASKGPITYHPANAFPPSPSFQHPAFSLVNISRCVIYPGAQPGGSGYLHARRRENFKNKSQGTTTILISHYRHFCGSIKKRAARQLDERVRKETAPCQKAALGSRLPGTRLHRLSF